MSKEATFGTMVAQTWGAGSSVVSALGDAANAAATTAHAANTAAQMLDNLAQYGLKYTDELLKEQEATADIRQMERELRADRRKVQIEKEREALNKRAAK